MENLFDEGDDGGLSGDLSEDSDDNFDHKMAFKAPVC